MAEEIKPPRLEDAGLEDCALPPESIREAFLKAALAVGSSASESDGEDESDGDSSADPAGKTAPSEIDGSTAAPTGFGRSECRSAGGEEAIVDGVLGLEIGEKSRGIFGNNEDEKKGDDNEDKPKLAEDYA